MKKYFKFAAIAVVALALTVACKNNKTEEPADTIDSMIEAVVEDTTDSIEAVALEADEPVKPAVKNDESNLKEGTGNASNVNANTNAKKRMTQKEAEKVGVSEAQDTKGEAAAPTVDPNKNASNRMNKR